MRPRAGRAAALVAAALVAAAGTGDPVAGHASVDDPGLSRQWGLAAIGAPEAWATATGSDVIVAIVDSGIDPSHPDLAGRVTDIVDCVDRDELPGGCVEGSGTDDAGHGTHVAGIVAASTDNGEGVAGVAPDARLLGIKVLTNVCTADGSDADADPECEAQGREPDVAQGVRWAADRGAQVINLSLGNETQAILGPGDQFAAALDYAWARGAIPVLVAGNDLLLPGSLIDVPAVVVAATTRSDARAPYSNGVGNVRWAVAAPGGEAESGQSCESAAPHGILSTYFRPASVDGVAFPPPNGPTYACVAGTSMAAPHVAGALAVLRSAGLGAQAAVDRLLATADDLGPPGRDNSFGSGRINLARAVEGLTAAAAAGPAEASAPPAPSPPATAPTPATAPAPAATPATSAEAPPSTVGPGADLATAVGPEPVTDDGRPPALPLTVAVLAVVGVLVAHVRRSLEAASFGGRTPPR
jgi:subtilisin family serine protease